MGKNYADILLKSNAKTRGISTKTLRVDIGCRPSLENSLRKIFLEEEIIKFLPYHPFCPFVSKRD